MKSYVSLAAAMALAFAASTYACDTKCAKKGDKATAAKAPCCAKSAKSANAGATKKPCCAKGAKTVAAKSGTPAAATSGKPCCAKGAGKLASGKKCPFPCHGDKGAQTTDARVASIMASLPSMTYRVGDFETPCFKAATAKAQETKGSVTFVVGDKTFASRADASVALVGLLTDRAAELAQVKLVVGDQTFVCPHAAKGVAEKTNTKMKYRLAGFDFNDQELASRIAKKVAEAVSSTRITYKTDGQAGSGSSAKTVTYVIGDQETHCDKEAKMLLARQIVRTIEEAAAATPS